MTWREQRKAIVAELGGRCVVCGAKSRLHLDHKRPKRWKPENLSKQQRLRSYLRSLAAGNLQLLCDGCHGAKTAREGHEVPWWKQLFEPGEVPW